jgi:hypothetical protein
MAGSRRDFSYTSDDGSTKYALNLDESNSKGILSAPDGTAPLPLFAIAAAPFPGRPPSGFKARYLNAYNKDKPVEKRKFYVGNPAAYNYAKLNPSIVKAERVGPDSTPTLITWVVKSARPERFGTAPDFLSDSGLDDGTPLGNA